MKYLLDASALLPLVTRRGRRLIIEASRERLITTDLAIYEGCNSLWKLATLLKTITLEDAIRTATLMKDLAERNIVQLIQLAHLDLTHTLTSAHETKLTFYDASYIAAAEHFDAILVTEDTKLRRAARKTVKVTTYANLEGRLTQR